MDGYEARIIVTGNATCDTEDHRNNVPVDLRHFKQRLLPSPLRNELHVDPTRSDRLDVKVDTFLALIEQLRADLRLSVSSLV